jgi:histidinol-phosphatase (PHP family)
MRIDYHTHHERCGHARGRLADYVEAAIAANLEEIGLSDHSPIYHLEKSQYPRPEPQPAMERAELPAYIDEMLAIRARFGDRIGVRLGVESDYIDGWAGHYRRLWRSYALDYVIGSIHWLGAWSIFDPVPPAGQTEASVLEAYFAATRQAARSGIFQIIGHIDCIKTSGTLEVGATPLAIRTIKTLAECDVAVELNTSGWRKRCGECYPSPALLEICHHYRVAVTIGSDAHAPDEVGAGLERAVRLLKEIGYREVATFSAGKRTMVPLE